MNTIKDRIKATKAQLRIAVRHYNQAERLMLRLTNQLISLERKNELARAKQAAKPTKRK
jgi:hypothetical protein